MANLCWHMPTCCADLQLKEREGQARRLMFPTEQPPVDDGEGTKAHELYVKSHGDYMPGEQRRCVAAHSPCMATPRCIHRWQCHTAVGVMQTSAALAATPQPSHPQFPVCLSHSLRPMGCWPSLIPASHPLSHPCLPCHSPSPLCRRRNYDWATTQVDPNTHRFGATEKEDLREGVRKALQPALDETQQQPATITTKLHADYKAAAVDRLGVVKQLGTGERDLAPDHTFGVPSLRNGVREPGVEELMKLSLSEEQQQPDADLGKSLREGYRNIAPEGRVFGVPSIRTDMSLPAKRSVTCTRNYGNEPDARQLLRPPLSVERGVHEAHYIQLRTKEEVQDIVQDAEINLTPDQFDAIFDMAMQADGEEGKCCLDTFFRARHHVLQQTLEL